MKRQVPGGEPGIFAFIRHGNDSVIYHMLPFAVSCRHVANLGRTSTAFSEPFGQVEEVVLLAPKHPRQRLPHDIGRVFADTDRSDRVIERVGLAPAQFDRLFESAAALVRRSRTTAV